MIGYTTIGFWSLVESGKPLASKAFATEASADAWSLPVASVCTITGSQAAVIELRSMHPERPEVHLVTIAATPDR